MIKEGRADPELMNAVADADRKRERGESLGTPPPVLPPPRSRRRHDGSLVSQLASVAEPKTPSPLEPQVAAHPQPLAYPDISRFQKQQQQFPPPTPPLTKPGFAPNFSLLTDEPAEARPEQPAAEHQ